MGRQVWLLTSARQLVRFIVSNMFLLSETLLVLLLANEVSPMKVGPWRSINKHPHPLCHLSPSSQEREGDERLLGATVYPLSSILLLLISWTPDFLYKHWGHLPPPWTLPYFASFPLSESLLPWCDIFPRHSRHISAQITSVILLTFCQLCQMKIARDVSGFDLWTRMKFFLVSLLTKG